MKDPGPWHPVAIFFCEVLLGRLDERRALANGREPERHFPACGVRRVDGRHARAAPPQSVLRPAMPVAADDRRNRVPAISARAKGIQGSNADFLLCAVAERHRLPILTTDEDFLEFARVLPVSLHPSDR